MNATKRRLTWFFVIFAWAPLHTFAGENAVFSVAGSASVVDGGRSASLKPGDSLRPQGSIYTSGNSILRFRLPDESFFALPSDSTLRIDEFQLPKNRADSTGSRAFFSLIKGGFRTVTGLIGKWNRPSYKVITPIATLGVRGTEYSVYYCPPGKCESVRRASSIFVPGASVEVAAAGHISLLAQAPSPNQPNGFLALQVLSGTISVEPVNGGANSSFTLAEGKSAVIEATFDANGNVIATGAPIITDQQPQIFAANEIHVIVFGVENPVDIASPLERVVPGGGSGPSLPPPPRIEPDIRIDPDPRASPS